MVENEFELPRGRDDAPDKLVRYGYYFVLKKVSSLENAMADSLICRTVLR
jgi:hypothetical protein